MYACACSLYEHVTAPSSKSTVTFVPDTPCPPGSLPPALLGLVLRPRLTLLSGLLSAGEIADQQVVRSGARCLWLTWESKQGLAASTTEQQRLVSPRFLIVCSAFVGLIRSAGKGLRWLPHQQPLEAILY